MSFPQGMSINTAEDLKRAYRACGSHFFEPDTMRFFRSRLAPGVRRLDDARVAFITSEQFVSYSPTYRSSPRKWTVRVATFTEYQRTDGRTGFDVDTAEPFGFQHADSLRQARRLAGGLS